MVPAPFPYLRTLSFDVLFGAFQQRKHPVKVFNGWSPTIENCTAPADFALARCRVHSAAEIPADLRGFAPATSSTVTTRQLPAHAQYQSAVRPSSTSSRRVPAFNNASATDASLYEVSSRGFWPPLR